MRQDEQQPVQVEHPRQATGLEDEKRSRNRELDPQLIWRGKDRQDWSSLVVQAPPLHIHSCVWWRNIRQAVLMKTGETSVSCVKATCCYSSFR
jgi:hypothetical protein